MLYEYMKSLGYSDEYINKIIMYVVNDRKYREEGLLLKVKEIFPYFLSLGYTCDEIIKISISCISLYTFSLDTIKSKVECLLNFGYKLEEVTRIIYLYPRIFNLGIENIKRKVSLLTELGFSRNESLRIVNIVPSMFGYSMEIVKNKFNSFLKNTILDDSDKLTDEDFNDDK